MTYGVCNVEGVVLRMQLLRQTVQLCMNGSSNRHKNWTGYYLSLNMNLQTLIRILWLVEDEL